MCIWGYYEEECIVICICDVEICDDMFGCIIIGKKCMYYVSR